MGSMKVTVSYSDDAHIWRLKLLDENGSAAKALELPGFRSMEADDDSEKINMHVSTWRYRTLGPWRREGKGWVADVGPIASS